MGALAPLCDVRNWEQVDGLTPETVVQYFRRMILESEKGCMIGTLMPYATALPPEGMLPCSGGTYSREDFPQLYSVIDPVYRIDADTFRVPDLRGSVPWGYDPLEPFETVGERYGDAELYLTEDQMPVHTHTANPHTHTDAGHIHLRPNSPGVTLPVVVPGEGVALAPSLLPGSTTTGNANILPETVTINTAGAGQAIDIRPPRTIVRWGIIAK